MEYITLKGIKFKIAKMEDIKEPILIVSDKLENKIIKDLLAPISEESCTISDFIIDENNFGCNALKNYLNNKKNIYVENIFQDGVLLGFYNCSSDFIVDCLQIPQKSIYAKLNDILIVNIEDLEE